MNKQPHTFYTERINTLTNQLAGLKRKAAFLAWARLFSFLAAAGLAWLLRAEGWIWILTGFSTGLTVFLIFVLKDLNNRKKTDHCNRLLTICTNEVLALQHQYHQFGNGAALQPAAHPYAADLDLFGQSSLFQLLNRTNSEQGAALLAEWLLQPATAAEIKARQTAVQELSLNPEWNQELAATGLHQPLTITTQKNVNIWLSAPPTVSNQLHWKIIRWLFPAISTGTLMLWLTGLISQPLFLTLMTIFITLVFRINVVLSPAWKSLSKITNELDMFGAAIRHVENSSFNAPLLQQQQSVFLAGNKPAASGQISRLKKIMDKLDYRLNPVVHIPLSLFLCWDLQQVFALEKWKNSNKEGISHWFTSLATLEVLSSFAVLRFNQPAWVFPEITVQQSFSCTALGHPLIPANQRVNNDFTAGSQGTISLITGSNMAGKSTFLRSCGVNIILAMAGAPVCAGSMSISPFRVMSSMRISDNLEENTSTFYAELKKLKEVIEAVNRHEPVFLLLDEILRGTNSADRHTGSKALIRQLIQEQATGIVATHDLELAKLQEEFPGQLVNYHFDVSISREELHFDYKLKPGICTSMNASLLMKKIGIHI